VVVIDTLERGNASAVLDAELIVGDIADERLIEEVCTQHDVANVIHFAAYKRVGESMQAPSMYFHNNVDATAHMLDGLVRAGVRNVVFSSSCSVYGTPVKVPTDESESIKPESVYADTKAIVERMLGWYDHAHGVRSVSLRYFNAAGASADALIGEDWSDAANLIPLALRATLRGGERLPVFGNDYPTVDGTCVRDYVHVDDLADAHIAALSYLADGGATTAVNIGSGVGSSVLQVLDGIARVTGMPVPFDFVPRRAGDPVESYADPSLAKALLGWSPRHDLDSILESAHRWHVAQLARA
jgi:UDP-glucose-4-epimerase GalE